MLVVMAYKEKQKGKSCLKEKTEMVIMFRAEHKPKEDSETIDPGEVENVKTMVLLFYIKTKNL